MAFKHIGKESGYDIYWNSVTSEIRTGGYYDANGEHTGQGQHVGKASNVSEALRIAKIHIGTHSSNSWE